MWKESKHRVILVGKKKWQTRIMSRLFSCGTSEMQKQLIADERERIFRIFLLSFFHWSVKPHTLSYRGRSEELLFTFFSSSEVLKMAHFKRTFDIFSYLSCCENYHKSRIMLGIMKFPFEFRRKWQKRNLLFIF